MNKRLMAIAAALTMALWCAPVFAQTNPEAESVPALLAKINEAYAAGDHETLTTSLERLHEMRPYNSEYMYRLALAYALLDQKPKAYELMLRMQQQGLAYDFTASEDSMNIRGTEVFDYVNELMHVAGQPFGEAEVAFTLPPDATLPGGIDWDETRRAFLIGTVADGRVLALDGEGQVSQLLDAASIEGMWAVLDVLVDEVRNRLWVTSAALPAFGALEPEDRGQSALLEFELDTLKLVKRYPVAADGRPHALGSMAMSPSGDIFIADRVLPYIFAKRAAEQALEPVLAAQDMVSLRGIAMQPDGRIMYIADRELGILVVDFASRQTAKLVLPDNLNVGGIDGLFLWNNHLVMIQNGIQPQRVMRLALDSSGTKVEAVRPLAVAQPEFDFPSFGAVRGDELYFFADGGWGGNNKGPVTVMRTALDASADLVPPEMMLYLEQERQRQAELEQEKAEKQ